MVYYIDYTELLIIRAPTRVGGGGGDSCFSVNPVNSSVDFGMFTKFTRFTKFTLIYINLQNFKDF